jgi:PST family polysaccharide transporter
VSDGAGSAGPPSHGATAVEVVEAAASEAAAAGAAPPLTLVRTAFLSGVSTVVRILAGFVVTKVIALRTGPETLALVGQFGGFAGMVTAFAGGGIVLGVTKYVAEYAADRERRNALLATALRVTLASSVVMGGAIVLLRAPLARWLLRSEAYAGVLALLGLSLPLLALNALLLAVMNGAKEVRRLVGLSIAGSVLTLLVSVAMVLAFGTFGALAALAAAQSAACLVTAAAARRSPWMRRSSFAAPLDRAMLRRLAGYSLMALATAVTLPLSGILIRGRLASAVSLQAAGYWQGVWQISDGYLLVVSTALSVYYLPRLSEITDPAELRREIAHGYRIILPFTVASALAVYLLRGPIVRLLFARSFAPMEGLFTFQLVGDVLKIASWLLAYLMVARARTRLFVATEVVFSATLVGMGWLLIPRFGVVGVTYAFAANYVLYLATMAFLFRREVGLAR